MEIWQSDGSEVKRNLLGGAMEIWPGSKVLRLEERSVGHEA